MDDIESDIETEPEPETETEKEQYKQARILHSVFTNFFCYTDTDGDTLNLCDSLLLIKASLDQNIEQQKNIVSELKKINQSLTKTNETGK